MAAVGPRPECGCSAPGHRPRRVVLTGGPGAGKTAVLEIIRRHFCPHVEVLPEAASILFAGGFPRRSDPPALRAAQRAIFHVQRELEQLADEDGQDALVLCDRGTVDGLAYWPDAPEALFAQVGSSLEEELARYAAVIHLRVPPAAWRTHRPSAVRIESPLEAEALDRRIAEVWHRHPRYVEVPHARDFLTKAARVMQLVREEVPPCCRPQEG